MSYHLQTGLATGAIDIFPDDADKTSLSMQGIQEIQFLLSPHGYGESAKDGQVGPKTVRVFKGFKKANGLPADTVLDQKTLQMLVEKNEYIHYAERTMPGDFGDESSELLTLPLFDRAKEVLATALKKRKRAEVNVGAEIELDGVTYQIQMKAERG